MATCTAPVLVADARCLTQGMSNRQLLASILCVLATANGMECNAPALVEASRCLWMGMSDRQLLASIALILCEGGGGTGGGTPQVFFGTGVPSGIQTAPNGKVQDGTIGALYYDQDPLGPQLEYRWDAATQTWY